MILDRNLPEIQTLVPHAEPMLLLDRVVAADNESLCAELTITADSLFFDEQAQGVAAWIGIEYMGQAIAAYAGHQAKSQGELVKVGFLLGTRRYEASCTNFLRGSVLQIRVQRVLQNENGLGAFECQIDEVSGLKKTRLATATVTVFQPDNVNEFLKESQMKASNE